MRAMPPTKVAWVARFAEKRSPFIAPAYDANVLRWVKGDPGRKAWRVRVWLRGLRGGRHAKRQRSWRVAPQRSAATAHEDRADEGVALEESTVDSADRLRARGGS